MTAQIANGHNYFSYLKQLKTIFATNQINQSCDQLSQEAENQKTAQMKTGQKF
jgi:hypothetical protein